MRRPVLAVILLAACGEAAMVNPQDGGIDAGIIQDAGQAFDAGGQDGGVDAGLSLSDAIAGTYTGTVLEFRPPGTEILSTESYTITAGDGGVQIFGMFAGVQACPFPLVVHADGTFEFEYHSCPQFCNVQGTVCPCAALLVFDGGGALDSAGTLSFSVHADYSTSCGDHFATDVLMLGRR